MSDQTKTTAAHNHDALLALRAEHVPRGVATTHPIVITHAEGATVWDAEGRAYLDFVSGISVLNVGHRHPQVVRAVNEQLGHLTHMCFQVAMYESYIELARRVGALVGGPPRKTLFLSTGAEATENAIKIARGYTNRPGVIAFTGSFHGRTLLGLTMTASNPGYRQNFGPFAPEVYHAPFPYEYRGWTTERALEALQELFDTRVAASQVAAIIIEPQLGEGGFVPAPPRFLQELRRITREHGIVFIADEIQSGFGRTGRMFGYQHAGIEPDLVAMAKSLGGGLPLAAVTGTAEIMDAPLPGGLGGTYAGNPLACAAGLAVLDVFEQEALVDRADRMGHQIRARLLDMQHRMTQIGDVRGLGCMLAIELVVDRASKEPHAELAKRVIAVGRSRGLLLLTCGPHKNVVRLLPPLTIAPNDLARGLDMLEAALDDALG